MSSCKKLHFWDKPKHNWYKITTVHLRLSEMWSSEWREEVMQANTKFKQCTMLETKFQKFIGLIYGRCFLLITVLFSVEGFSLLLWIFHLLLLTFGLRSNPSLTCLCCRGRLDSFSFCYNIFGTTNLSLPLIQQICF